MKNRSGQELPMQRWLHAIYGALEALPIHSFEDEDGGAFRVTVSEQGFSVRVIPTLVWGSCSFTVEICLNSSSTVKLLDLSVQTLDDQVLDTTLGERSTYTPPVLKAISLSCSTAFLAERLCMGPLLRVLSSYLSLFDLDSSRSSLPLGERSYYKRPSWVDLEIEGSEE